MPDEIYSLIVIAIVYNSRYFNSYMTILKKLNEEFHLNYDEELKNFELKYLSLNELDFYTACKAISNDEKELFIRILTKDDFDENLVLPREFYPPKFNSSGYTFLELCSLYGAVDCFKLLMTDFDSEITDSEIYKLFHF